MKLSRIRGRKCNDYLRRTGKVWKGRTMTIRWLKNAPRHPGINPDTMAVYAGTAASIKLDKSAVRRNRMRRRCREALRRQVKEVQKLPTMQLLISPRQASLTCDFSEIQSDIADFLSQV